jgi:hypothetical protein
MGLKVGVDLDNTLIDYRGLFHRLALEEGWIEESFPRSKSGIKDRLVAEDGNDLRWQELQARAYGPRILEAQPHAGALEFLQEAEALGCELHVVSHKTEASALRPEIRLRDWAARWISAKTRIQAERIHWASSRAEKVHRIAGLGCRFFVDDLHEVLEDPAMPRELLGLWFCPEDEASKPHPRRGQAGPVMVRSWKQAADFLRLEVLSHPGASSQILRALPGQLPISVSRLAGSGNSRLTRVGLSGGRQLVVKRGLRPEVARIEFEALSLLRSNGFTEVPEAIDFDAASGSTLLSFVEGRRLGDAEVDAGHVRQAIDFLLRLSRLSRGAGQVFPHEAADSRRRLSDYSSRIRERRAAIEAGRRYSYGGRDQGLQIDAVLERLDRAIDEAIRRFEEAAVRSGFNLEGPLPPEERILSPSDFGFHNALVGPSGRLVFLDFEYFGWDDPAKLVADFFHSVAQDLPDERKQQLLDGFDQGGGGGAGFRGRFELVRGLIALEWILIVLNVLSPPVLERKVFANPQLRPEDLIATRLARAKGMLERIEKP